MARVLGYTGIWACIPKYWVTLLYGDAYAYTDVPRYMAMHAHIMGYPAYGYPVTWGCIPICCAPPVYGDASL